MVWAAMCREDGVELEALDRCEHGLASLNEVRQIRFDETEHIRAWCEAAHMRSAARSARGATTTDSTTSDATSSTVSCKAVHAYVTDGSWTSAELRVVLDCFKKVMGEALGCKLEDVLGSVAYDSGRELASF